MKEIVMDPKSFNRIGDILDKLGKSPDEPCVILVSWASSNSKDPEPKEAVALCEHYHFSYSVNQTVETQWGTPVETTELRVSMPAGQYYELEKTILIDLAKENALLVSSGMEIAKKIGNAAIVKDFVSGIPEVWTRLMCRNKRIIFSWDIMIDDNGIGLVHRADDLHASVNHNPYWVDYYDGLIYDGTRYECFNGKAFSDYGLKPLTLYEHKLGLFVAILNRIKELKTSPRFSKIEGLKIEYIVARKKNDKSNTLFSITMISEPKKEKPLQNWF